MSEVSKEDKDLGYSSQPALEAQEGRPTGEYDAVFGEYKEGQVHYKSVGW
jgi:hypothetical protein